MGIAVELSHIEENEIEDKYSNGKFCQIIVTLKAHRALI